MLPIAGNSEAAPDDVSGMLGGLYHIDGATLYPTYDRAVPFVQINPYNGLDRVYFEPTNVVRLILQPRADLVRKMYQTAPLETAFPNIEALSRIYIYYLKQLGDTPMAGVLDLMDFSSDEAEDWAISFREMLSGIDPLKIPILYDHTKPAKFVGFGRSPQDLNVVENFKRYAELTAASFGLSIGDLRLFEHERVLAGVEASQRVTNRSGIGFYAQAVEDLINGKVLKSYASKLKFKFKLGMTGEEQQVAQLNQTRAQTLMTLTGNQPVLKPQDAQAQMKSWKMLDVDLTGVPSAPGLEGLGSLMPSDNLSSIDENADAVGELANEESQPGSLDQIDQIANEMAGVAKAIVASDLNAPLVARRKQTLAKAEALWRAAFKNVGRQVKADSLQAILDQLPSVEQKADTAAEVLDRILDQVDWWQLPDILTQLFSVLKQAYDEGALQSISELQAAGYAAGKTNTYVPPEIEFAVTHPRVIELIEQHGAELVAHVDQGTKYFLRQKILAGVKNNDSAYEIAKAIAQNVFGLGKAQASQLSETRIRSIVNTELNWADSRASFDMMVAAGLRTKGWRTRGYDVCDICLANEAKGFVDLDYEYDTVFKAGGATETTLHPPAHPMTCHCYLTSNPEELGQFFDGGAKYWTGGEDDRLRNAVEIETEQMIADARSQQKSLSYSEWGHPDRPDKPSRFDDEIDAQHWLASFGLVPIISDSDIDAKGGGWAEVGVIWQRDGYVDAALVDVDDLPTEDVKAKRAKLFGARGLKSTNVVKSHPDSAMIALEIPEDIATLLSVTETPHITIAYLGKRPIDVVAVEAALSEVGQSTLPFVTRLTGAVEQMGPPDSHVSAAIVYVSDDLKRLHDDVIAALRTYGQTGDATWGEFKPHVTVGQEDVGDSHALAAQTWFATGLSLYVGDTKKFFPFRVIGTLGMGSDGYLKHLPGKHAQQSHAHVIYHGTAADNVKEILKRGIVTNTGRQNYDKEHFKKGGGRGRSVYLTTDPMYALHYGYKALNVLRGWGSRGKVAIFKVRVPKGVELLLDEKDQMGHTTSWRHEGKIPAEWIVGYAIVSQSVALTGSDSDVVYTSVEKALSEESVLYYVPVIVRDDDVDVVKHLPGHHSQSSHGHSIRARTAVSKLDKAEERAKAGGDNRLVEAATKARLAFKVALGALADNDLTYATSNVKRAIQAISNTSALFDSSKAALESFLSELEGQRALEPVLAKSLYASYADKIPGPYRKEFAEFVRVRSGVEPDLVADSDVERHYTDFVNTMLVGGFDYWRGEDEYPPLVRSVVKSDVGYQADDAPAMAKAYLGGGANDVVGAAKWLASKGYEIVPEVWKHLPDKHDQQSHGHAGKVIVASGAIDVTYDPEFATPEQVDLATKWVNAIPKRERMKSAAKKIMIFADPIEMTRYLDGEGLADELDFDESARGAWVPRTGTIYASLYHVEDDYAESPRALYHEFGHSVVGMDEAAASSWVEAYLPSVLESDEEKAFYTGTGYSGVHDPDWDRPPDTGFFNRTNFEKLKRHRKLAVDGNLIRAIETVDVGGDPVVKLHDVAMFNSQAALEEWLRKVNAKPAGGHQYEITAEDIEGDNTWPR